MNYFFGPQKPKYNFTKDPTLDEKVANSPVFH